MKKALLSVFILFTAFTLQADIVYTDYGDGWRIGLNENVGIDLNDDGQTDFYINGFEDEIGFVPMFGLGCFTSPDEYVYNSIGSRELSIHQPGEMLQINTSNLYNYIDDDRGSMFSLDDGFADGWEDLQFQYVGFVVILPENKTWNGWIRVAVDQNSKEMIIKDMAYETDGDLLGNGPGIEVGDIGSSSVADLNYQLRGLTIAPNPANEMIHLQFDYQSTAELSIALFNNVGQLVLAIPSAIELNNNTLAIPVKDLSPGTYVIRFASKEGVSAERVVVAH